MGLGFVPPLSRGEGEGVIEVEEYTDDKVGVRCDRMGVGKGISVGEGVGAIEGRV